MQEPAVADAHERLLRLRAERRGTPVDLLVHYEVRNELGCKTYRIITVEELTEVLLPIALRFKYLYS